MPAFEEQILDIVRSSVKPPLRQAVRMEARLRDDLGLDSLGMIKLLMAIEERTKLPVFEIDSSAGEISTLRDLARLISRAGTA
jgi:acyl carrier protein